jgi:beta-glucosidase
MPRLLLAALTALLLLAPVARASEAPCAQTAGRPWCDTRLGPDERAGLLVQALTLDEKLSLLAGASAGVHTGATAAVPRLGVPQSYNTDGPVGVRQGNATALPAPMAEAATFDPAIARLHGATIGAEARAKGNDGVLGPTVNVMRTPLNGRTFEAFGEDPWLVAQMTAAWIKGAQAQGVYATVKHFAANNQEGQDPTGRLGGPGAPVGFGANDARYYEDSIVDERTLREVYLPQFEAAVRAGVGSVMCSYNRVNGQWACANHDLIDQVLEREWGFRGLVMSDWVFATHPWDTATALNGGMDLEMPSPDAYNPVLVRAALLSGQVSQGTVDEHVRRLLRTLFAFGFFDRPAYANDDAQIDVKAHATAARKIEESAVTLLRNRGALPIKAASTRSIAVIGPYADRFVTGGGSGNVTPFAGASTVLGGIRERAGNRIAVTADDGSDPARAAALARQSDVAVVVVGDYQTEGADKSCLTLECPPDNGDQDALVQAVAAAQRKTVVVLETGGPVLTPWRDKVNGLLAAWYPGQEGGRAVARVLFGDVDPGGRLPATFPASEAQLPTAGDPEKYPGTATQSVYYKEGVLVGYRWYDAKRLKPAYPFGYGLSYTRFGLSGLRVRGSTVSAVVRNTGRRSGIAVAQLYLRLPQPSPDVVQPPRQLRGVAKVRLRPGRSRRVKFTLPQRSFAYWNTAAGDWRVATGCYRATVAFSSRGRGVSGVLARGGARCGRALSRR